MRQKSREKFRIFEHAHQNFVESDYPLINTQIKIIQCKEEGRDTALTYLIKIYRNEHAMHLQNAIKP